jgi:hypothetical protein
MIPKSGYDGIGKVTETVKSIKDVTFEINGVEPIRVESFSFAQYLLQSLFR